MPNQEMIDALSQEVVTGGNTVNDIADALDLDREFVRRTMVAAVSHGLVKQTRSRVTTNTGAHAVCAVYEIIPDAVEAYIVDNGLSVVASSALCLDKTPVSREAPAAPVPVKPAKTVKPVSRVKWTEAPVDLDDSIGNSEFSSMLLKPVQQLLIDQEEQCWIGTLSNLVCELTCLVSDEIGTSPRWPVDAAKLARLLRVLAPAWLDKGVQIVFDSNSERHVQLRAVTPKIEYNKNADLATQIAALVHMATELQHQLIASKS